MGDFYPGINEPMKPLKLPMSDHKYYDENVPAFRRDDPTDAGKLWLDTKINFLNEVMKFLPRTTTNTLTKQEYSKDQVKDYGKRLEVAESVYNTDIFSDKDVGLWKGNQSTVLDQLFTDQSGSEPALSRFAGLLGVPFDGHIALGTYIVDDEDNTSRPVTFMERTENGKGTGVYYMQYTNKNGVKLDYDITDADTNYLIPIIKDLKGDSYAKNFREGVNFHATVLDFQNTNASYDNDSNQFVVDANGDGYADGVDTGTDGKIDKYDSLSTKALDTSMYQSEYLKELGVYTPVLDYSNVFSDLMSGSLFGTDTIDREYSDSDRKTYNALQNILDGKETSGEFKSFLTKIKFEVKSSDDKTMDYIPNIYELARKGIDFSDTTTWNEKDIFYLSMLMIESRRRYTYAMSTIFGVQGANPDVKDVLTKYANPDIWQCSPLEDYLYMDVCTSAGRTERMYNYFIPKDVGQNITDPTLQKIEKINWLNKRSVEYFTNDAMYTMYQDATNMALKDNKSDLLGLKIPVTSDMDVCVTDFNNMLEKTNSILQSGGKLNETQLSQMLSLFKEAKDSLLGQISSSETNLTAGVSSTALNNFLSKYPTSISLSTEVDSVALSTYVTAHSPKYAYVSATGALTVNGIIAADEATSLFAMITNTADREKINALKQQVIDLTENIASTELTKFLNDNSSKYVYASGTGKLTVLGTMTEAECNSLKGYFPAKDTNTLTGLLNLTTTLTLGVVSSGLTTFLNANSSKYAYVSATGALTVSGVMTESECNTLKGLYSSTEDKAKIDSLMASSVARQSKYEYNSATGQLIVNGTMTIEEAAALKLQVI
jgi:hypothetical protein